MCVDYSQTGSKIDEKSLIIIKDSGGEIKEEIIYKIFDPYFTTKFPTSGTGIGLYISKILIEKRLRGNIYVKNTKDKNGVEFKIII